MILQLFVKIHNNFVGKRVDNGKIIHIAQKVRAEYRRLSNVKRKS